MLGRKDFLALGAVGLIPVGRLESLAAAEPRPWPADGSGPGRQLPPAGFPAQDPELVREIVLVAHSNVERVEALATEYPELAKAAYDWGFGDWESALGAASHMGRRDIAHVLLAHGARPTLFSAAMLGEVDVVRAHIEAAPGIQGTPGPHSITLLAHAKSGGEDAALVVEYLEEVGGADQGPVGSPLGDAERAQLVGNYRYGAGEDDVLAVSERQGTLFLARQGHFGRAMFHQGGMVFLLGGAESVRVGFPSEEGSPEVLQVAAGSLEVVARREE